MREHEQDRFPRHLLPNINPMTAQLYNFQFTLVLALGPLAAPQD